jgi:hypothetical protein
MMTRSFAGPSSPLPDNRPQMTPAPKRQYRPDRYLNPESVKFVSEEEKKNYKIRAQCFESHA